MFGYDDAVADLETRIVRAAAAALVLAQVASCSLIAGLKDRFPEDAGAGAEPGPPDTGPSPGDSGTDARSSDGPGGDTRASSDGPGEDTEASLDSGVRADADSTTPTPKDSGVHLDSALADGDAGCTNSLECPDGQACGAGGCSTSCNATEPCNAGCCTIEGVCVAGYDSGACGNLGTECFDCTGSPFGFVCMPGSGANPCGCILDIDCMNAFACADGRCTMCDGALYKCTTGCCDTEAGACIPEGSPGDVCGDD